MRMDWINQRLRDLRHKGKTQSGLAEAMGLTQPRIAEIIAGRRNLFAREVPMLAAYLELPEIVVISCIAGEHKPKIGRLAQLRPVMVRGAVQAGLFAHALERPEEEWYPSTVMTVEKYADCPQFGLEALGPSMDEFYPHGTILVCVLYADLGVEPQPGEHVVVQRSSPHHEGYEATVKELRRHTDGSYWLWPRSTHPEFQQPWRLPGPDEDHVTDDELRIVAKVITFSRLAPGA